MRNPQENAPEPRVTTQAKHWFFTINNPDKQADLEILEQAHDLKYCVVQLERGESGTLHLQGIIGFEVRKYFRTMKSLHARANWSVARSVAACIRYCQKEDTRVEGPWIYGDPPEGSVQGRRKDLDDVVDLIKQGQSVKEIFELAPKATVRYFNNIAKLVVMYTPSRDFITRPYLFYGPTETGKTRAAVEKFPNTCKILCPKKGNLWFDGYDPMLHETVIIDDFYGGIKWSELLNMLDRYAFQVNIKGASVQFRAKTVIFTSNQHFHAWYPNMDHSALERRFRKFGGVILFNNDGTKVCELGTMPPELLDPVPEQNDSAGEEQPHDSGNSQDISLNSQVEE